MAVVICPSCDKVYNDEYRWTICPHNKLGYTPFHPDTYTQPKEPMNPTAYSAYVLHKQADQSVIRQRVYDLGIQATMLDNASRGLCDDAGEVAGCVKKWLEYGQPLDTVNLLEELGDCLWRLVQAGAAIDYTLQDIIDANVRKLDKRYKGKATEAEALEANRDRAAEREAVSNRIVEALPSIDWSALNGVQPGLEFSGGNPHNPKVTEHWAVGRRFKPKFQSNPLYLADNNHRIVLRVHPDGYAGISDLDGVLELKAENYSVADQKYTVPPGSTILAAFGEWMPV